MKKRKLYKLKFTEKIFQDNTTIKPIIYYRTYRCAYNKFKKLIQDKTILSASIWKYEKDTDDYTELLDSYLTIGRTNKLCQKKNSLQK